MVQRTCWAGVPRRYFWIVAAFLVLTTTVRAGICGNEQSSIERWTNFSRVGTFEFQDSLMPQEANRTMLFKTVTETVFSYSYVYAPSCAYQLQALAWLLHVNLNAELKRNPWRPRSCARFFAVSLPVHIRGVHIESSLQVVGTCNQGRWYFSGVDSGQFRSEAAGRVPKT